MEKKKGALLYKLLKPVVKKCFIKMEVVGEENLPEDPCVLVGNHSKNNGPLACEFYSPRPRYTWCAGEMMNLKEVPAYAYKDFWSDKPKYISWLYKIASYLIAPLSVLVFTNANTIGVYRDTRIISTFKTTISRLQEGMDIVIFPEHNVEYNHIVCEFQERFVDVAKLYYKKTGKELDFVPLYIAPYLKKMYLGKPIRFCASNPIDQERKRICEYLMKEITNIACGLPLHTVVPYPNIPKKDYPTNIPGR